MKDRETELLDRWRSERRMYAAWGEFVKEALVAAIDSQIRPEPIEKFLRIPVQPRTKDESSLLAKAFHRGKSYKDPYCEIEDKVGLRIVVLFSDEIRVVEAAIKACDKWSAVKARDFEEERISRPFEFDYQSLHYIAKANKKISYDDIDISQGTPCEIQVRTLLQHTYSELTHDTIYKPRVQAEPAVKRAAAKSMALIEATDDYFSQVREKLDRAQAPDRKISEIAKREYCRFVGKPFEISPLNTMLIDHLKKWIEDGFEPELTNFIDEKSYLSETIKKRSENEYLYRQPSVILLYWVINMHPRQVREDGPLSDAELEPLYADLGLALHNRGL